MLSLLNLLTLVPAFLGTTLAAPVAPPTTDAPLNIYVQGEALTWDDITAPQLSRVNRRSSGPDDGLLDIVQWAENEMKGWQAPKDAVARRTAQFNGPSDMPSYLVLDYNLKLESCDSSVLKSVSLADGLVCDSGSSEFCA